jgi:hypothetical protein
MGFSFPVFLNSRLMLRTNLLIFLSYTSTRNLVKLNGVWNPFRPEICSSFEQVKESSECCLCYLTEYEKHCHIVCGSYKRDGAKGIKTYHSKQKSTFLWDYTSLSESEVARYSLPAFHRYPWGFTTCSLINWWAKIIQISYLVLLM